jgi:hypothetical protein
MALIDNSTTWTGVDATDFYSASLLVGDSKETFRQMANVKSKEKVASLELGSFLQADSCAVAESGNHTIDDITVEVCDFAFNIPVCEKDYENMYLSETMKPGSNVEQNFPAGLVDYIKNQISLSVNAEMERIAWTGSTTASPPDLCDGILKKLLADGAVVDIASPLPLTESNIASELIRIIKAAPKVVKNKGKGSRVIYMSVTATALFELSMYATSPAIYAYNRDEMALQFAGYKIVTAPGLYDNTIVFTDPMNLIYATDLAADEKQVEFVKNPTPGSGKKWNFIGSYKAGFQIINGSEVVLYGGTA